MNFIEREIHEPVRNGQRPPLPGQAARERLLAPLPVKERRLDLAGVSTTVLEGGDGPPLILLHGPGAHAAHWMRVIPALAASHRTIAPDLPGHGASEVRDGPLHAEQVLAWLDALIEQTCATPPTLVGELLGGAIAACYASRHSERLHALVLVDAFGLAAFQPTPAFAQALTRFQEGPTGLTHEGLWQHCAHDLESLRQSMGEQWPPFEAYNLECACAPGLHTAMPSLMAAFAVQALAPADLARIAVPTTLIWGRHDLATPLPIAQAASARYGWPLHVVEGANDAPAMEKPQAFVAALRAALGSS